MIHCYNEGALRAYLDGELPDAERTGVAAHLASCAACRSRLEEQRALAGQVATLLAAPTTVPDPYAALPQLRGRLGRDHAAATPYRATPTASLRSSPEEVMSITARIWAGPRRSLAAALAAIVAVLSLLLFPPVRAAADQLLQIFRVQQVLFMPISQERIEQLQRLNFDKETLFVAQPRLINTPAAPRTVGSLDEAAALAGFRPAQPALDPAPTATQIVVHDRRVVEFQVNVEAARQLLALMDVNDVTLPDALGAAPITADVPSVVETRYQGDNYTITLIQSHSPTVTLPDGVDLAQLGKAVLRLLGMPPEQADVLSRQIDWSSTLIFPFPADVNNIRQVVVNDTPALLVSGGNSGQRHWQLYWQHGDRFSMLEARGQMRDADLIAIAESIR